MKSQNTELLEKLNPAIELGRQMLLAGVLVKNVIKHFTNLGLSFEAANNIVELSSFRANQLSINIVK